MQIRSAMRALAFVTKGKILILDVKIKIFPTVSTVTPSAEFLNNNLRSSSDYNMTFLCFFPKAHPRREALVWNP